MTNVQTITGLIEPIDEEAAAKVAAIERIMVEFRKLNETEPLPPEFDEIISQRMHYSDGFGV
jgi:hypothetical protein